MSNLLDKASIILTPTAYNNGEALCVKPSDGSGDFDFSRNSAATRVNAQGLVENVQILSSNLVQNGDFSEEGAEEVSNGSFSQAGVQLVTNGSFDTDSNWNKQTSNWTISNGYAVCDGLQTTNSSLFQDLAVVNGNSYRIDFTITDSANDLNLILGATTIGQYGDGTHTVYVEKDSGGARIFFQATASNAFQGSIDNVSCVEVGQDWTFGTGWSVGDGVASRIQSAAASYLEQTLTIPLVQNKVYKITYTATIPDGNLRPELTGGGGTSEGTSQTTSGTYTDYIKAENNHIKFRFRANADFNGSVTNISVKEVGQNWDFGGDWELVNGTAEIQSSTNSFLVQSNVVDLSVKNYKLQYEVITTNGSNFRLAGGSSAFGTITLDTATIGVKTIYLTSNGTARNLQYNQNSFRGSIDDISVIEITDDTNLPRINYEGFSYQDALGSELVVNGDFATDSDWSLGTGWSIGDNKLIHTGGGSYAQQGSLTAGTEYKVVIDVAEASGSGFPQIYMGGLTTAMTAPDIYTFYITAQSGDTIRVRGVNDCKINSISVKEYSGQEVVPDSGCGHWLWEPQSTNTINNSNSDFSAFNMDLVYNDVKSPDGTQNAFKATTTTTGGSQFRPNQTTITPSTFSIFLKYGNNQWYQVINSSATGFYANIDVQNGVFGTSGADTDNLSVKDYGNGWFRFSGTFTSASTNGSIRVYASSSSSAGWAGVSAPIGSYVYGYGFQVEALDYATSYIPTSGTSVTRNQDVCTNGGSLASINSTEGTLYAEIAALADDGTYRQISLTETLGGGDVLTLDYANTTNKIRSYLRVNGIAQSLTYTLSDETQYNKIAVKYKDTHEIWVNGNKVASLPLTLLPIDLNILNFNNGSGGGNFYGKTKALVVYKEALTDEELTELTTI